MLVEQRPVNPAPVPAETAISTRCAASSIVACSTSRHFKVNRAADADHLHIDGGHGRVKQKADHGREYKVYVLGVSFFLVAYELQIVVG